MSEKLVDMTAVNDVVESGWDVGFFKDGRPEGMVVQQMDGTAQTLDGEAVSYTDELKLGCYRMCEDPFKEIEERLSGGKKIELRLR